MSNCVRSAVIIVLLLIASAAIANADIIQILSVNLMLAPCQCSYDDGSDGSPASGNADFTSIAPWTLSFLTPSALSWQQGSDSYYATFGNGGYFDMTGPEGLTFSGIITSGQGGYLGFQSYLDVTFSGQWSDGLYGGGAVQFYFLPTAQYESDLQTFIAPEPSSLVLLATGAGAIWSGRKRFRPKLPRS